VAVRDMSFEQLTYSCDILFSIHSFSLVLLLLSLFISFLFFFLLVFDIL